MVVMGSLILRTAARFLLPLLLLFSVFVLLRGHNEPGGGFIAGLIAAVGFSLYLFAFDAARTRILMSVDPRMLLGTGLLVAVISGIIPLAFGEDFFTSIWWPVQLPLIGEVKLSTPLIFDIGVYLVVLGAVMTIILALDEAEQ
ncbi:MAG: Na+/H+ antiporter subunit B [Gammaproteobacteria bacterium]